jgi:ureidoglycolate lyase
MKEVRVQPLSAAAFAPFGDVISAGEGAGLSANQGTATRFDWCTPLVNLRPRARANVAVFRSVPKRLPFTLALLERHPFSSQAFVPMTGAGFLVCVAPTTASGAPALNRVCAFVGKPGQGVNYRVGVWHHPIVALEGAAQFLMVAFEDGSADDCVVFQLPRSVTVHPAVPRAPRPPLRRRRAPRTAPSPSTSGRAAR